MCACTQYTRRFSLYRLLGQQYVATLGDEGAVIDEAEAHLRKIGAAPGDYRIPGIGFFNYADRTLTPIARDLITEEPTQPLPLDRYEVKGQCPARAPYGAAGKALRCRLPEGHEGPHFDVYGDPRGPWEE